jgi:hypothetical protein
MTPLFIAIVRDRARVVLSGEYRYLVLRGAFFSLRNLRQSSEILYQH